MHEMRFCVSGYTTDETRRIVDLIRFMGGSARKTQGDYLIAKAVTAKLYPKFVQSPNPVLTMEWIEACWRKRRQMDFDASVNSAVGLELMETHKLLCFAGLKIFFLGWTGGCEAAESELDEMSRETRRNGRWESL